MEDHGGRLLLEDRADGPGAVATLIAAARDGSGRRQMAHDILIVDDEPDIRLLIDGVLRDEGYDTRGAGDCGRGPGGVPRRAGLRW